MAVETKGKRDSEAPAAGEKPLMDFIKMHGAGNDFIIVDAGDTYRDWSRTARAACDRHYGIGGDGLLLLLPSDTADFRMRVFNADGSEADICGNGLRCLVRYYIDREELDFTIGEVTVETMVGLRKAVISGTEGKAVRIQTGMGRPAFPEEEIPVEIIRNRGNIIDINSMLCYPLVIESTALELNLVNMGNPHAVHFHRGSVAGFPLSRLGSQVERHEIFPRGVNFEVAQILDRGRIEARVWERGVGETLACGSGACAITVAARMGGYVDDKVEIILPGGALEVEWDGEGEVLLSGPAETVFTGQWPDENSG
jgi:diaminopimelate epimerase